MREYEILEDYERFSSRNDRHAVPPRGIKGGKDGRVGSIIINPGTDHEKRLPARFADFILRKGDIVRAERPGGGGFGIPFDRNPEDVLRDVIEGYVSIDSARDSYGVMVNKDTMKIDENETAVLRSRQKAEH